MFVFIILIICGFFFFNSNFIYFTTITKQVHLTYIHHAHWYWCLRLCNLCVGANCSTQRKPTCPILFILFEYTFLYYTQSHLFTCIYRIALYYSMVTILDFHFRVYNPYTLISHSWTTVSYHFCTKNSKKYSLS